MLKEALEEVEKLKEKTQDIQIKIITASNSPLNSSTKNILAKTPGSTPLMKQLILGSLRVKQA